MMLKLLLDERAHARLGPVERKDATTNAPARCLISPIPLLEAGRAHAHACRLGAARLGRRGAGDADRRDVRLRRGALVAVRASLDPRGPRRARDVLPHEREDGCSGRDDMEPGRRPRGRRQRDRRQHDHAREADDARHHGRDAARGLRRPHGDPVARPEPDELRLSVRRLERDDEDGGPGLRLRHRAHHRRDRLPRPVLRLRRDAAAEERIHRPRVPAAAQQHDACGLRGPRQPRAPRRRRLGSTSCSTTSATIPASAPTTSR